MATSKLLKPTNVTISIPEFTDQPDQRVNSNCIDKSADAINNLSEQIATIKVGNSTSNILVDALNVDTTTVFTGVGGSYSGNIPDVEVGYGIFIVFVRNTIRIVLAISRDAKMYTTRYYNNSWNSWKTFSYTA